MTDFADKQYGTLTVKERKNLGAFYTPPNLVIKMIEKFQDLDDDIVDDESRKVHYAIPFKSQKEKDNFREVYKNSFIQKWLRAKNSPRIRVLTCGYEKAWTDEDLYKYFDLTPEEVATIEQEIK